jgi:hypothetical protein
MANAENINVGISGLVYVAPTGTAAPTSALGALNAAFVNLGEITTDALEHAVEISTEPIMSWNSKTPLRYINTEGMESFSLSFMETSEEVLEVVFGATVVDGKLENIPSAERPIKSFVFDVVDNDKAIRIYLPKGQVTAIESINYNPGEPTVYGVTISALGDSNGKTSESYYSAFEPAAS